MRIRTPLVRWVFLVLLLEFCCFPAFSADYVFVNLADTSTHLVVPNDGILALSLLRKGDAPSQPETIEIAVSEFRDPRGVTVPVALLLPGEPVNPTVRQSGPRSLTVDAAVTAIRMQVGPFPSPRTHAGSVLISRGGVVLRTYPVTVARARSERDAKVLLDRKLVSIKTLACAPAWLRALPFLGDRFPCEATRFSVTLRDETGDWDAGGLFARLEAAESPDGSFDPLRQLQFQVNGTPVDLWAFDPAAADTAAGRARVLPAHGEARIEGALAPLPVGTYSATIRLGGTNSQSDSGQLLTLTVKVRKSVWWAVAGLIVGIGISLVVTVILKSRADLLRLRRRILDASPWWLNEEPPTRQVTWVRSIFSQAEAFPALFSPAVAQILGERVDVAEKHLPLLRRIGNLRRGIERQLWDPMVHRRAEKILRSINNRLEPGDIDAATAESVKSGLDRLEKWFDGDLKAPYWEDLKRDIDVLLPRANLNTFEGAARATVEKLAKRLASPEPTELKEMVARENDYAALKLIVERYRDRLLVSKLAELCEAGRPIEELFEQADRAAWDTFKEKIRFAEPKRKSLEPFQPFQPLLFELTTEPPELGDNYLFKHALRYHWNITLECRKWWRNTPIKLMPETEEPRVYQYAPRGCPRISVLAGAQWGEEIVPVRVEGDSAFSVPIERSALSQLIQSIETTEVISLSLAVVVGVFSGLLVQYYGNDTFGTARDLLAVLLWGAGANQASSSFVDVLARFPRFQATPAAASAATPAAGPTTASPAAPPAGPKVLAAAAGAGGAASATQTPAATGGSTPAGGAPPTPPPPGSAPFGGTPPIPPPG